MISRTHSPASSRAGAARWLRRLAAPTVLVLAAASAIGVAASPRAHGHGFDAHPMAFAGAGIGMPGPGMERMFERLGASAEQRAQIERIAGQAREDMRARAETRRQLHQKMSELFAQPTIDAAAAEALRQQMLAEHDQASQRGLQTMLAISEVLTPEQRAQMAKWRSERAEAMKSRMKSRDRD
ncbi:MAG: Spy/CpxP family protein refolding chaperone [Burkholderiales bacterium]|nr:Spy/CpxP family protein refolding chaperone [Burkholderiales bacterium]